MSEVAARPREERRAFIERYAETNDPGMRRELLAPLIAPESRGFFTSRGPMFRGAVFARDSIKMAEDLHPFGHINIATGEMNEYAQLSHDVIITLAKLQGVKNDPTYSEEQPGKIHHEYRHRSLLDDKDAHAIIERLRNEMQWMPPESNEAEVLYYGSADATPLLINLVQKHVDYFGRLILSKEVRQQDGRDRTIADSIALAADYLYDEVGRSESGLHEFRRTNKKGLVSQSWKDSPDAFLHEDGARANYDGGVAAVDIQGYTYDALVSAWKTLRSHEHARQWRERAYDLRERTLEKLWMPDKQYFAQGLDYDDAGKPRQIKTITSDAAILTGTGILNSRDSARGLSNSVTEFVLGPEFVTPVGIRLRALGHTALEKAWSYHGSRVSWAKGTNDVVKALERQRRKSDLHESIIQGCINSGDFYEFWKVGAEGEPQYVYGSEGAAEANFEGGEAHNPQEYQGWTLTAFLRAVKKRHKSRKSW